MKTLSTAVATFGLLAMATGCTAVGELAYDSAAAKERAACERFVAMADRQACLQRVNAATQQAAAQRKKD